MAGARIDALQLARFLSAPTTLSRAMSPLSALAPDQRAVLELLLRQGRDYAELAELLGLPESGVRSRAHTALAALAPDRVAPVGEDGAVADWILGQQDDAEAARTRGSGCGRRFSGPGLETGDDREVNTKIQRELLRQDWFSKRPLSI
jgi:hypothetical protein